MTDEKTKALQMLYPIRRGTKIYVCVNDVEIELHPLSAANIARAWQNAICGSYVAQITDFHHD